MKQARKKHEWQELYYIEAIPQGAMDLQSEAGLERTEEQVRCKFCKALVSESAWCHFSWKCFHFRRIQDKEIQQSKDLQNIALDELGEKPSPWLRGMPTLPLLERPLSTEYWFYQGKADGQFQLVRGDLEPIQVEGCTLGGDGSGGEHTKDPRIRQCGWGLVVLHVSEPLFNTNDVLWFSPWCAKRLQG